MTYFILTGLARKERAELQRRLQCRSHQTMPLFDSNINMFWESNLNFLDCTSTDKNEDSSFSCLWSFEVETQFMIK